MNAVRGRHVAALLAASSLALAAASARATEDGQDSLISGIAHTFGLAKTEEPRIDYRERSKLVVPPKMTLPPPAAAASGADGAWPTDAEILRDRAAKKVEDGEPSARMMTSRSYRLIKPGDDVKVTTSGFDGRGPACRVPDPKTGECPQAAHPGINWNPLTWVGFEKKPKVVLGPEPERENLVDPPKGYREPAEGVGAKVDD